MNAWVHAAIRLVIWITFGYIMRVAGIEVLIVDSKEAIAEASRLEKCGLVDEAYAVFQSADKRFPNEYSVLMGAGRTSCKLGKTDAGIDYYRRASELFPDRPEPFVHIGLVQHNAQSNLDEAVKTYSMGVARFPDNDRLRDLEIKAKMRLGRYNEFIRDFDLDTELDKAKYGEDVFNFVLIKRRPSFSEDEVARYRRRIVDIFGSDVSKIRYAKSLIAIKKHKEALEILERVSNDAIPNVVIGKAICKSFQGKFEESKALVAKYLEACKDEHDVLKSCILVLDASPDIQIACNIIGDLNKNYGDSALENLIEFASSILPPKRALLRGNIRDSDVRLSESGDSKAVVLAFTGFARKTGAIPFTLIDRFFAGHGVAVGSLIDEQGCLFFKGIPQFGGDFKATVAGLKRKLAEMDADKIYTLGTSGGGSAAMVYGCALRAKRAISFAGPTELRKSVLNRIGDNRGRAGIIGLNNRLDANWLNVRGWLEASKHRCPIHAYYNEKEKLDEIQAKNISHLPEVSLHPVARYSVHESIGTALGTGQLLKEFNSVLKDIADG